MKPQFFTENIANHRQSSLSVSGFGDVAAENSKARS